FHQHTVAGGLDDAAVVLGDLRIDEFAAQRLEAFERAFLIRLSREYPATSAARIAARRRVWLTSPRSPPSAGPRDKARAAPHSAGNWRLLSQQVLWRATARRSRVRRSVDPYARSRRRDSDTVPGGLDPLGLQGAVLVLPDRTVDSENE